jgi:hypothetical protein
MTTLLEFSKEALAFENCKAHNKAMKKPMTLNAGQLGLLRDFTNFPVLQIFTKASNPSSDFPTLS